MEPNGMEPNEMEPNGYFYSQHIHNNVVFTTSLGKEL